MQTAPDGTGWEGPGASMAGPSGRLPRAPCRRRLFTSIILLLAGLVLLAAAFAPWWSFTVSAGGTSVTITFLPGSDYRGSLSSTSQNGSASAPYRGSGLGALAGLYESVLIVTLIAAVLVLATGAVALLTELGKIRGRWRGSAIGFLALLAFLVSVSLVVVVASLQPTQFNAANPSGFCSESQGATSPCNSFSGSLSASGGSATWGGGAGWDLAIFSAILSIAGAIGWWVARNEPFEVEPMPAPRAPPTSFAWAPSAGDLTPSPFGTPPPAGVAPPARTALVPSAPASPAPRPMTADTASPVGVAPAQVRPAFSAPAPRAPPAPPAASAGPLPASRPYPTSRPLSAYSSLPSSPAAARAPPAPSTPAALRPSPGPAAGPAPSPLADTGRLSDVQRVVLLRQRLDSGEISPEQFARSKAELLASPPSAPSAAGRSPTSTAEDLRALERLRDVGAVSGPEYLQLRRGIVFRG